MECKNCKTLYLSPRPTYDLIHKYYKESKATDFWYSEIVKTTIKKRTIHQSIPRAMWIANLTEEFFGYLTHYFVRIVGEDYEHNIIYILYNKDKIEIQPVLRGNILISTMVIWIITLGTLMYIIVVYLIFFKFHGFFFKILFFLSSVDP